MESNTIQPCSNCGSTRVLVDRLTVSTKKAERNKPAKACLECNLPRCEVCGTGVSRNRIYCSSSCKQKVYASGHRNVFYGKRLTGEANGFFGRTHSNETRAKMRKAHTIERKAVASERARQQWNDPAFRQALRKNSFGKFGWHESPKAGSIYHRSSWELDYYVALDQNPNVLTYETETLVIPYEFDGKQRNYYPDVIVYFINGSKKVIEIKPTYKLSDPKTQAKLEAAKQWSIDSGIEFELVSLSREEYNSFSTGVDEVTP